MQSIDDFMINTLGKSFDYDGAYGAQCVDYIKLYLDRCFGIKPESIGNAEAYFRRYSEISYLKENFVKIENTPDFIPQKGDIVCWGTELSANGHVAIATGERNKKLFLFLRPKLGK